MNGHFQEFLNFLKLFSAA